MPDSSTKMVKSAVRVMEVLEFFNGVRSEATVMDLVRVFDYPQSSASELLRCLASLGYLSYDRYKRTYRPTARVTLLGSWSHPGLFRSGVLLPMMDRIARETGEVVMLGAMDSNRVRYLHVVKPHADARTEFVAGDVRSPFHSALGRIMVSQWEDRLIQVVARRLNAEEEVADRRLRVADLVTDLHNVSAVGYAVSPDEAETGRGMVAINVDTDSEQHLAIAISCPSSAIREADQYAAILRNALAERRTSVMAEDPSTAIEEPVARWARSATAQPQWRSNTYREFRA